MLELLWGKPLGLFFVQNHFTVAIKAQIMQKSIFLFALVFSSCIGVKETIIDVETKEKMIGFSPDCKYQIGKTKKSEYSDELIKELGEDSIYLDFRGAAFGFLGFESETLVSGSGAGKYMSSRGLKRGDSLEKALKLYGKPIATDVEYWRDMEHNIIWGCEGLFYENIAILIDTTTNTVKSISIGRAFPIDKKYRRKSFWFKP